MTAYQIALGGGKRGGHAYVLKSPQGIIWSNVTPELEQLLQSIPNDDVSGVSLGPRGQFAIKYWAQGVPRIEISRDVPDALALEARTPNRVILGPDNSYWLEPLTGIKPVYNHGLALRPVSVKKLPRSSPRLMALGAKGYYCFHTTAAILQTNHKGLKQLAQAVPQASDIACVAISTLDPALYMLVLKDGTMMAVLPKAISSELKQHLLKQPPISFIPAPVPRASKVIEPVMEAPFVVFPQSRLLRSLDPWHREYAKVYQQFEDGWRHPGKPRPSICGIYAINLPDHLMRPYRLYKPDLSWGFFALVQGAVVEETLLFHGTRRTCSVGDTASMLDLCSDDDCCTCCILRTSFDVSRAGTAPGRTFLRFGVGIYTTSVSSKAHDYTAAQPNSTCRAMIVARVKLGRKYELKVTTTHLTAPPTGFHSVSGVTGVSLNYDEQVVYRADAIRPAYLIVYEPR